MRHRTTKAISSKNHSFLLKAASSYDVLCVQGFSSFFVLSLTKYPNFHVSHERIRRAWVPVRSTSIPLLYIVLLNFTLSFYFILIFNPQICLHTFLHIQIFFLGRVHLSYLYWMTVFASHSSFIIKIFDIISLLPTMNIVQHKWIILLLIYYRNLTKLYNRFFFLFC